MAMTDELQKTVITSINTARIEQMGKINRSLLPALPKMFSHKRNIVEKNLSSIQLELGFEGTLNARTFALVLSLIPLLNRDDPGAIIEVTKKQLLQLLNVGAETFGGVEYERLDKMINDLHQVRFDIQFQFNGKITPFRGHVLDSYGQNKRDGFALRFSSFFSEAFLETD